MEGSSQNLLTRQPHTSCVTIDHVQDSTVSLTNHKRFCRSTLPVRWRDVIPLLIFVFALQVQSANALRPEYGCKEGESLPRFDACDCGEYARIVNTAEAQELDQAGIQVSYRYHGSKQRQQWYVCIQCTHCGDGILVARPCTPRADTTCSADACADPAWKFDFGSKSCKPPTTLQPKPSTGLEPAIVRTPTRATTPRPVRLDALPPGAQDDFRQDAALWPEKQIQFGLVAAVAILLILLVVIVILVIQMKHKLQKMASASPYSSQNTSNSSVNV